MYVTSDSVTPGGHQMNGKCTILLADDHPMFRLGLRTAIESDDAFEIVAECDDGAATIDLIERLSPRIAIIDWQMPKLNGLEILKGIQKRRFETRTIILTMYDEEEVFNEALDSGAHGFVLKDNAIGSIIESIKQVNGGSIYLSPSVSMSLLRRTQKTAQLRRKNPGLDTLTRTERRVLRMISENMTTREAAKEMGISPYTVETHRRNISRKLELTGSYSLLQFAIKHRHHL